MVSSYYNESVERGAEFQQQNKSWDGKDTFSYHRQIKDVVQRYNCKTVLDYGCGKGHQWSDTVPFWPNTMPETFANYLGVTEVTKYDPCVAEFSTEPEIKKYDLVICTQVLPSIPDPDIEWVRDRLMLLTGKACFIGMHSKTPKAKKLIYDKNYFQQLRTEDWYREQFNSWNGSALHWWFRSQPYFQDWINK